MRGVGGWPQVVAIGGAALKRGRPPRAGGGMEKGNEGNGAAGYQGLKSPGYIRAPSGRRPAAFGRR